MSTVRLLGLFNDFDAAADLIREVRDGHFPALNMNDVTIKSPIEHPDVEELLGNRPAPIRKYTLIGSLLGGVLGFLFLLRRREISSPSTKAESRLSRSRRIFVLTYELLILGGVYVTVFGFLLCAGLPARVRSELYSTKISEDQIGVMVSPTHTPSRKSGRFSSGTTRSASPRRPYNDRASLRRDRAKNGGRSPHPVPLPRKRAVDAPSHSGVPTLRKRMRMREGTVWHAPSVIWRPFSHGERDRMRGRNLPSSRHMGRRLRETRAARIAPHIGAARAGPRSGQCVVAVERDDRADQHQAAGKAPCLPTALGAGARHGDDARAGPGRRHAHSSIPSSPRRSWSTPVGSSIGIYCTPCHGASGTGNGLVGEKLTVRPFDLTSDGVQSLSDGFIFGYLTFRGAVMPSYANDLSPIERWHVVNYLRHGLKPPATQQAGNQAK